VEGHPQEAGKTRGRCVCRVVEEPATPDNDKTNGKAKKQTTQALPFQICSPSKEERPEKFRRKKRATRQISG